MELPIKRHIKERATLWRWKSHFSWLPGGYGGGNLILAGYQVVTAVEILILAGYQVVTAVDLPF